MLRRRDDARKGSSTKRQKIFLFFLGVCCGNTHQSESEPESEDPESSPCPSSPHIGLIRLAVLLIPVLDACALHKIFPQAHAGVVSSSFTTLTSQSKPKMMTTTHHRPSSSSRSLASRLLRQHVQEIRLIHTLPAVVFQTAHVGAFRGDLLLKALRLGHTSVEQAHALGGNLL